MAVLALGVLILSRTSGTVALCAGFGLLGAGFGTVMVAATHAVVRAAAVGAPEGATPARGASAGVAGGLQQTAMNVGPVLGVAVATALMGSGGEAGLPLTVLAALALAAAVAGIMLPGRDATVIDDHGQPRDRTRVPARR
jgi:hypothetical protein